MRTLRLFLHDLGRALRQLTHHLTVDPAAPGQTRVSLDDDD